jgi:hypothetical protein
VRKTVQQAGKPESSISEIRKKSEIRNPNAAIAHFQLNSSPGQRSSKNRVAAGVTIAICAFCRVLGFRKDIRAF